MTREIIRTPRYRYVHQRVKDFVQEMKINSLPVDPIKLIEINKWTLRTFQFYAQKHGVSLKDVIEAYGTEDAFTVYCNGNYSIAYNDRIRSIGRIRFSLMHEIGHIYLRHLEEFNKTILSRGGLTKQEYKALESEADTFAAEVLAPYEVMLALEWSNYKIIQKMCGLSVQAAQIRASQIFNLRLNGLSGIMIPRLLNIFIISYLNDIVQAVLITLCLILLNTAQFVGTNLNGGRNYDLQRRVCS